MRSLRFAAVVTLILAMLAACSGAPTAQNQPPPTTASARATTQAPAPTVAQTTPRASTTSPTEVPLVTLTAELSATIISALPPVPTPATPDEFVAPGIEGIHVVPLVAAGQPLWLICTIGLRSFDADQEHFVAVYTRTGNDWQELARATLPDIDGIAEEDVQQVVISADRVWFEVSGVAGAHSGVYELFSFDGKALTEEASNFSASPGGGNVRDVGGDSTPEVVLDQTDSYVFCYACGVRLYQFQVLRWDGNKLTEVTLETLPSTAPAALRDLNNQAVTFARAGLWKDAQAQIAQARAVDGEDQTVVWNAALIDLTAGARSNPDFTGAYPLLDAVFYGDYDAARAIVTQYDAGALFGPENPLVVGTVAEDFPEQLASAITQTTTLALEAKSDIATAYFLRGWAQYLVDPTNPQVITDLEAAARLDPDEPLFRESVIVARR